MAGAPPFAGQAGLQWDRLQRLLAQTWDWQQRVAILGISGLETAGGDVTIRTLASRATLFVQRHIQHDGAGGGGATYNTGTFVSSTRVDCRAARQQDHTIARNGTDNYFVWFIPVFHEPDDTYTLFDGADAEDQAAFWGLGT